MSAKASPPRGEPLPPIPFERVPITPLPEVIELPPQIGWPQWDRAVEQFDAQEAACNP